MNTTDNEGIRAMKLRINKLRLDGGTQPRAVVDYATTEEYADAMQDGAQFPPVIVFYDGSEYWLADGFHRVHASMIAGFEEVFADVRQGTRRDAVLYSVGANAVHGMRRTNADKRRAVQTLLEDVEWAKWSDREIARRCAVSDRLVNSIRPTASANNSQMETRLVERNGTVYEQRTENIGRRAIITNEGELIVEDDAPAAPPQAPPPTPVSAPYMQHEPSSPLSDPLAVEHHVDEYLPEDEESEAMYLTKLNYKRLSRKERTAFINWLNLRGDVR